MGRRDRLRTEKPRTENPIIHRDKLFGGQVTAEELHAKLAWGGANCSACPSPAAMRVQIFVALRDMSANLRRAVEIQVALGNIHTVPTALGPAVRTSYQFACHRCSPALERAAARGPSYAIVDIDRGPGPDRILVGVAAPVT